MIESTAIIYGPGSNIRLVTGSAEDVQNNVFAYLSEPSVEARLLTGTDLQNLVILSDPRVPATIAEFDAAYPDADRLP